MRVVLVTYNIRFGGRGRRPQIAQVLQGIAPDVVVLQEATDLAMVEAIAGDIGLPSVIAERARSVAVLSRRPIAGATRHRTPTGGDILEVQLSAPTLRLFGVHLTAGLSQRGERRRLLEVARLLDLAGPPDPDTPTVILGDFNAVALGEGPAVRDLPLWIRTLLRFDGGVRSEVMSSIREAGYVDAFRALDGSGAGFTMPAGAPSVRLDYLMVDPFLAGRVVRCAAGEPGPGAAAASDHLPLIAELDLLEARPTGGVGDEAAEAELAAAEVA